MLDVRVVVRNAAVANYYEIFCIVLHFSAVLGVSTILLVKRAGNNSSIHVVISREIDDIGWLPWNCCVSNWSSEGLDQEQIICILLRSSSPINWASLWLVIGVV